MELHEGIVGRYHFDNGYGASVARRPGSYGYEDGLYELAVLHGDDLCYNTPVADDVIGFLSQRDVSATLDQIAELPQRTECDHFSGFLRKREDRTGSAPNLLAALFAPDKNRGPQGRSLTDALERLASLRHRGAITEDEFAAAKKRLLD